MVEQLTCNEQVRRFEPDLRLQNLAQPRRHAAWVVEPTSAAERRLW